MIKKVVYFDGTNVFVVRRGNTRNKKISEGKVEIVQTFTFSFEQWLYANNVKDKSMKEFFKLDGSNCLDCPFSVSGGNGGCYTHKFNQYIGFISMLKSIKESELTIYSNSKRNDIITMSNGLFVRFGTYGEPSLLPIDLIESMTNVAKTWTGYTHQYNKNWATEYSKFFMASIESATEETSWRAFRVLNSNSKSKSVQCPASKEANYSTTCAKCGLCSGLVGKGTKDVKILEH